MKKLLAKIIPLAILSYASHVYAQDTQNPMASECRSLKDNIQRLQCYDLMSKNDASKEKELEGLQSGLPDGDVGGWKIEKMQSQIDDSWNVFVSLASTNTIRTPYGEYLNPSLYAVCREAKTELFVSWGVFLGTDQARMIQRIDADKATQKMYTISTDNKSVFYRANAIPTIKKLMDSKKLYLQIVPYSENAIDATFDLSGLSEAIKPLRHACKW